MSSTMFFVRKASKKADEENAGIDKEETVLPDTELTETEVLE